MRDAAFARWQTARGQSLGRHIQVTDVSGIFSSLTKTLRLLLQSAMLGLGAWLVLLAFIIFQVFQTSLIRVKQSYTWQVHNYGMDILQKGVLRQF